MPTIRKVRRNDKHCGRSLAPGTIEYTEVNVAARRVKLVVKSDAGGKMTTLELNKANAAELMRVFREVFPSIDDVQRFDPRAN